MFTKLICIAVLAISCACATPGFAPVAYSAPLVAAPAQSVLTTQTSQVVGRSYNGIAPLAYTARVAAPLAYSVPAVAAAAPLAYAAAAPYAAAPYATAAYAASPYAAASYVASPYAAPFASPYAAYRYSPYVL